MRPLAAEAGPRPGYVRCKPRPAWTALWLCHPAAQRCRWSPAPCSWRNTFSPTGLPRRCETGRTPEASSLRPRSRPCSSGPRCCNTKRGPAPWPDPHPALAESHQERSPVPRASLLCPGPDPGRGGGVTSPCQGPRPVPGCHGRRMRVQAHGARGLQTTGFEAAPEAETAGSQLRPVAVPWQQACSGPCRPLLLAVRPGACAFPPVSAPPPLPGASRGSRETVTVMWLRGRDSTSCACRSLGHRPPGPVGPASATSELGCWVQVSPGRGLPGAAALSSAPGKEGVHDRLPRAAQYTEKSGSGRRGGSGSAFPSRDLSLPPRC